MRCLMHVNGEWCPITASFTGEPWEPRIDAVACCARAEEAHEAILEAVRAGFRWGDFLSAVEPYPPLKNLALKYPGVRPGRFLSLYEALVDTIIEQRIALRLALRIKAGIIEALGPTKEVGGLTYYGFPPPDAVIRAGVEALRGLSLTRVKARAVYEVALAEVEGRLPTLREVEDDPWGAAESLTELYGVGPWTAELAVAKAHPLFPVGPHHDLAVQRGLERVLGIPAGEALKIVDSVRDYAGLIMYLAALDYELMKSGK